MQNEILFTERQRFNQWWLWLLILGINGLFIFLAFRELMSNNINIGLILGAIINFLFTILLFVSPLDTQIRQDGIYVRFFPFRLSFQKFLWDTIAKTYIREYSPIGEFGGWGLRYSQTGKAYNVSGNKGIQLIMTDGSRLLIGTNKPDEAIKALQQIDRYIN